MDDQVGILPGCATGPIGWSGAAKPDWPTCARSAEAANQSRDDARRFCFKGGNICARRAAAALRRGSTAASV
jgi:hypothetical protein